jgi:sugar transferase EpsL
MAAMTSPFVEARGGRVPLAVKRAFDLVVATVGLIVALPVIAALAMLTRLSVRAPAFYRQTRPGRLAAPFRLWKLRTMTEAREASGALLPDEQRLTRFGRWLRRWSLDELPQLINVVTGDMSLVGPRPLLFRYVPRYSPRQRLRLLVRPGITGWAQVNGRNDSDWATRLEHDAWYVENWSLGLDLRILLGTCSQVLSGRGARPGAGADVEEFWGEMTPPADAPRSIPVEENEGAMSPEAGTQQ